MTTKKRGPVTASEIQAAQLLRERQQPTHPDFSVSELQAAQLLGTNLGSDPADDEDAEEFAGEEFEEDEEANARRNRERVEAAGRFLRALAR